jgi:hypothetical protein
MANVGFIARLLRFRVYEANVISWAFLCRTFGQIELACTLKDIPTNQTEHVNYAQWLEIDTITFGRCCSAVLE